MAFVEALRREDPADTARYTELWEARRTAIAELQKVQTRYAAAGPELRPLMFPQLKDAAALRGDLAGGPGCSRRAQPASAGPLRGRDRCSDARRPREAPPGNERQAHSLVRIALKTSRFTAGALRQFPSKASRTSSTPAVYDRRARLAVVLQPSTARQSTRAWCPELRVILAAARLRVSERLCALGEPVVNYLNAAFA